MQNFLGFNKSQAPTLTPRHSDILMKCPGGAIPCHRVILAARSPFFDRLLATTNNKPGNKLEIKEFSVETVEAAVEFMYTGEVRREVGDPAEVVRAAVTFQLPGLANIGCQRIRAGVRWADNFYYVRFIE